MRLMYDIPELFLTDRLLDPVCEINCIDKAISKNKELYAALIDLIEACHINSKRRLRTCYSADIKQNLLKTIQ